MNIIWIVVAAVYLYDISVSTGDFEIMKASVGGLSVLRRRQLLLVAFCFGAFIEGCAGFGPPVAIAGAFMIGLGFKPFHAAALNLIANTAPVAWGAIGTPVHMLAAVTLLPEADMNAMIGRILPITAIIVPFWLGPAIVPWEETFVNCGQKLAYLPSRDPRPGEAREDECGRGEGTCEKGGQNLECLLPGDNRAGEPEGHDDGGDGQNASDHGVHVRFGKQCDGGEHVHRRADRAPSYRRGIGDQVQRGSMEGLEAQTDHEGAGDGHRRTESRAALDEGAKAESNEQELQTAIRGDAANGGLHDLEVSGADRDVVEKDGRNDNPHDIHQAGSDTVEKALASQGSGHMEDEDGDEDRSGGSGQRGPVRFDAQAGQQNTQNNYR